MRLPGKGNSNSHGARPVHLIITMIRWIRTSRLSKKNALSTSARTSRARCPCTTDRSRRVFTSICFITGRVCSPPDGCSQSVIAPPTGKSARTSRGRCSCTTSELGIQKTVKARFWPWLEPFWRQKSLIFLSWYLQLKVPIVTQNLPWREAGPPKHLDHKVDSDQ